MIAAQPPSLPIFISAQTVPGADMSSQCPPSVAAIKTDHILPVDGPSHRHSGSENLAKTKLALGISAPCGGSGKRPSPAGVEGPRFA